MLIWDQRVDNGGTINRDQYYSLYTNGNWQTPQSLQTGLYDYSMPMDLAYNAQGDAILIWVEQGGSSSGISAIRYSGGAWGTAFDLDTNITWIDSKAEVHLDAQGNANVLWENNQIKTRRYDINNGWSNSVILSSNINTGNQLQHIAGNADGHTVAVWKENGNLYTARYLPGSGWKPVQQIGTNGAIVADSAINIDDFGHAKFAWIADTDANGINNQLASTHLALGMPQYSVAAGDSWASIAQSVYGNSALAAELRAALGDPELSAGQILELPMQLIETGIDLVTPYIEIQGNETWESIAQAVYGNVAAASALRAILGDPQLLPGLRLQLPANLSFAAQTNTLQAYEVGRQLANNAVDNSSGIGYDREVQNHYDHMNRLITRARVGVVVDSANVSGAGTAQYSANFTQDIRDITTRYAYDALGNIIQETDADGNIIQRSYDVMGRMTSETDVTRKQTITGLADIHAALIVKEPGSATPRLEWAKPPIPRLQTTLQLTANGITTTIAVTDNGTTLSADVATLASGQYHYRVIYRREGETTDYAQASGDINLMTANAVVVK